jgi:hypothetical protein
MVIIINNVISDITIIEMKTKAALEAANEHLSAAATLDMTTSIYFFVTT